jgi:hypothetical protein
MLIHYIIEVGNILNIISFLKFATKGEEIMELRGESL